MKVRAKKFNPKFVETLKQLGWKNECQGYILDCNLKECYVLTIKTDSHQYDCRIGITPFGEFFLDTWANEIRTGQLRFNRYTTDQDFVSKKLAKIAELTRKFQQGSYEVFLKPEKNNRLG